MNRVTAIVEKDKCHPSKCSHECIKYDPLNRKQPDSGFHIGVDNKAHIAEEVVTEMHRICANKCPFSAIKIVKLPEKLKPEALTHKFGQNAFELYGLPLIKKGEIVGIIGRNGIGKSTSVGILSNTVKPNLGNYALQATEEEIYKKYAKTMYAEYFKQLYGNKLKVAYKPQRIEMLPQLHKGKVIELLQSIDKSEKTEHLLKELDATQLKQRTLSELSGGELQKIAIIATLLKKADIYYFDEPSSFLDIMARIKMAKLVRSLKEDGAAVMVVEHDLATLDYISDEIQIVYGAPAAYGVFSQSKGVRRGINDYLDGYLAEDNVRFRSYPIVFHKPPPKVGDTKRIVCSFPDLEKSYDTFHLKVHAGQLRAGEVLTVMGANGLGKTTFLKLLAGVEKPDKGKLEKINISYKEQYPKAQNIKVIDYLQEKAKSNFSSGWYKQNVLEKLNLHAFLDHSMRELSGGELQKVFIAGALSTDAPLVALDEPSAFIDVEDRLKVAEVIKEFTEKKGTATIVVDHDVQFMDYISDAMLVFEGSPGKEGHVHGPCSKEEGMNRVLKMLNITYRKDKQTGRAQINKPESQLDREQKKEGHYYYS
ncbi:MAG TPA: ribosome biogenesis/translation initiation ATPase RLI [Candidatus Nanoarchaeia archaeon]|nr:ribosome biogenesis/translation initiation ATPase RLI [Candidatus Nanoarchaeia archaeon]